MRFIAHYAHIKDEKPEYYKTLDVDSVNEAIQITDKWTRKGYRRVSLKNTMRDD